MARSERRRQKREAATARPEGWFVETDLDRDDAEAAVAALADLPPDLREVVVARIWGKMTFEQISAAFDLSVSSAYRRYETGIGALAELMRVYR
jgi:RNA polymerase sigma-70 factor (ECF subfamily)